MYRSLSAIIAIIPCALTAHLHAAVYKFTLQSASSTAALDADVSVPLIGTFKGNYDPITNPTGTMTRPGLTGGSGNMPINYTGTVTSSGNNQSNPAGNFLADVNTNALTIDLSNLTLDALNGATPAFPATFNVLYSTFRTFQPNSTFFGGVTLPVPLGNVIVNSLHITQAAPSSNGTLTPLAKNQYDYVATVPVNITYEVIFSGTVLADTSPAALLVTGTLTIEGNVATASSSIQWSTDQTNTGPFEPIVDVPVPVPTVFPTGSTANLLVSGTIQSVNMQLDLAAQLSSAGVRVKPGDVNGDLVVNVTDLLAIIGSWGVCQSAPESPCPADVSPFPQGDGVINVADLLMTIANWGS